jgi:Mn2+/Fe2+ NRAMP family transporter
VKVVFRIALGIIAAIGGFLDIGDLVFNTQAGANFGYDLLWTVVLGTIGIGIYAEMCGRVAAVTQRPVFDVIRMRLGYGAGLLALIASSLVNLLTVAAELGGLALIMELLFDTTYSMLVFAAVLAIVAVVTLLPFGGIERLFGYGGLMLFVFVVAAIHQQPDWHAVGQGFVPSVQWDPLYLYFVVGVFSAALMPYEVHFYSSGAIEERWDASSLKENRANAILGYGIGGLLAVSLIVVAGTVFQPLGVDPGELGTVALPVQQSFGETGLLLALGGMLFAIGGATIDSSFAGAYNVAQFLGWEWGRYRGPRRAPRFAVAWLLFLALGIVIAESGINPVDITEYSVVFSVIALPFTYLPILLIAGDRTFMGRHVNGPVARVLGWLYFVLIVVLAVAAIPLLLITNGGGG